jgi:hypothetical protein
MIKWHARPHLHRALPRRRLLQRLRVLCGGALAGELGGGLPPHRLVHGGEQLCRLLREGLPVLGLGRGELPERIPVGAGLAGVSVVDFVTRTGAT